MRNQGKIPMRTEGEIESAISKGGSRFEQDYMGRGPKDNDCGRCTSKPMCDVDLG